MKILYLIVFVILSTTAYACIDNDGDGYGVGCPAGPDCNDNNSLAWATMNCFRDIDGDWYNHWYGYNCDVGMGEFCWCGNGVDIHEVCSLELYPFTSDMPLGQDYCDDNPGEHTMEGCGLGVPEFTSVGVMIALAGAGYVLYRKRK